MGWWQERVVPHLVDRTLRGEEIGAWREVCCEGLAGRILELGFGSGLNVRHYPAAVTSVAAVEPSEVGWGLSARRRARTSVPIERVGLDGEHLDAEDAGYDAVLCTFTLCTIPDPGAALAEVRRVLRPGGTLHLLEHGRAPTARVLGWQRRLEPLQRRIAGGCHLTRDPVALAEAAGLEVGWQRRQCLPGPAPGRPWTYGYVARASRPG